jgi:TRAP-type C4-dicarboxylate transport system permease small subunit
MLRRLAALGHALAGIALAAITLMVTVEVVLRTFFSRSFMFVDEVSGYLLVALAFFGATWALEAGGTMRVDFIYERLPKATQAAMDILFDVVGFLLTALLTAYFVRFVASSIESGITSSGAIDTPLFIPQLSMVGGMGLMSVTLLLRALSRLAGRRHDERDPAA